MEQDLINWLILVASGGIGFMLRTLWAGHAKLHDQISRLEVLVAGDYVKREDLKTLEDRIFEKLDRIQDTLNEKQDKSDRRDRRASDKQS